MGLPCLSVHHPCSDAVGDGIEDFRSLAFHAAKQDWPTVRLPFAEFCAHLDRLGYTERLPAHTSALFLCAACAMGNRAACRILDERYLARLIPLLTRINAPSDFFDEVLQQARERLLVGAEGKIRTYEGKGTLEAWLSRIVRHMAIDALRAKVRAPFSVARSHFDALLSEKMSSLTQAEPDSRIELWNQSFQRALREGIRSLEIDERKLLHSFYVEEASIADLVLRNTVDRATIYRRLGRCKRKLRHRVWTLMCRYVGRCTMDDFKRTLHDRGGDSGLCLSALFE